MAYSTAQGRRIQKDKFGRPFRSERTMGPDFNLDAPPRLGVAPRSPTVASPGTPEEIRRAFGGPIALAPGASKEQTAAAAARLAGPRFGPGEYQQYQQSIGVNASPPTAADPDAIRAVQGIVGASPARQERLAMAARAPATRFVDGQGYMPLSRPSYGESSAATAGRLGDTPVGVGMQTSGVGSGGRMGTPLMRGGMPGPSPVARKPFEYAAGRGPTITSPGGQGEVKTPEEFQQAWKQMSGDARGGALRMALADQRERAAANPDIAANIARNEAAIQRQTGGAPAPGTNPLFDRERQRKELTKAGMARPLAAMFANLHGNPEAQAALAEQMASEETERIQSYNQPFGSRTATGGRGDRGGMGVAGVMAARQEAEKLDESRRQSDFVIQGETRRQSLEDYDRAIAGGMTPLEAEEYVQQTNPAFRAPITQSARESDVVSGLPTETGAAPSTHPGIPQRSVVPNSASLKPHQATAISSAKTEHQARAYLESIGVKDKAAQDATLRTYYYGRGGGVGRAWEAFTSPTVPPPTNTFPRTW